VFAHARDREDHFVEMASRQSRKDTEKSVRKAKTDYTKAEGRVRQLDDIIAQIYEDKVSGELSAERFTKMLGKYEQEQTELIAKMDALRPALEQADIEAKNIGRFLRMVKRFTEIEELTAEVVSEFIERIEVGETEIVEPRKFSHWKDEKRQKVRILYNYIGDAPKDGEATIAETREKTTVII